MLSNTLFISFEGGEGAGKTTQSELLRSRLIESGFRCILLHEPGGTPLGDRLRSLVKGDLPVSYGAELFIFSAARAELVSKVVKPSLDAGIVVVIDRYVDSTTAYQGYGRGIDLDQVRTVNALATQGLMPDLTILLDMPPEKARKRLESLQMSLSLCQDKSKTKGRIDKEDQRRFEQENMEFHRRVRQGYLKLAKEEPRRWRIIDASLPPQEVGSRVWREVQAMLSPPQAERHDRL